MPQKLSREVMRRKDLCDLVLGAVRIHRPQVGASLGETFTPRLREGEEMPDFGLQLELCGREAAFHCDQMEAADEAHRRQLVEYAGLRSRRGELLASLKSRFLDLRSICSGLVGKERLGPLGLDFNVAQDSKGMLRQAEILVGRLREPGVELTSPRWEMVPPDPEALARSFDDDVAAMRQIQRELVDQVRRLDALVVAKHDAIDAFDEKFLPLAQWLEASFRVAGHVELADRIRPTVRRLTRNGGSGENPSPDEPSEDAPAPPSGTSPEDDPPAEGSESAAAPAASEAESAAA